RLTKRAFVLVPLVEIAPDLAHPLSGKRVTELLAELDGTQGVLKWEES
ncbi:MAG TPA: 2-amino-4-hydroxy-6-hydroxymethyldihydropteridine diphosphokinase, partial [Dehalococcoidia bacterium]|nr:2-amino-4-hydroxy-6-hydroxymethyldihydropteridine diphosphokinase [Dehalococcoidia bacterium]